MEVTLSRSPSSDFGDSDSSSIGSDQESDQESGSDSDSSEAGHEGGVKTMIATAMNAARIEKMGENASPLALTG